MASLTVRNIPDDAKLRFRQIAAAHGRSMEEHLRQLVMNADTGTDTEPTFEGVRDVTHSFRHFDSVKPLDPKVESRARIDRLIALANGAGEGVFEREKTQLREFDF